MADAIEKPRLIKVAELFQRYGVEYIVIGGEAAVLLGSPLATFDTDLCYCRSRENLQRLAAALQEIQPVLRGAPPDLPFCLDAQTLEFGSNFTFDTKLGPLDLLGWVDPIGSYEELLPRVDRIPVGDLSLQVIALDDLIAIKSHLHRPKDLAALQQLQAIKILRDGKSI